MRITDLSNIRRAFQNAAWTIHEPKLDAIAEVLSIRTSDAPLTAEEIQARIGDRPTRGAQTVGAIAVIPLCGTLYPKANLVTESSGGCSVEQFVAQVEAAANDPAISAIVLDTDSPGGAAQGIPEAAARLRALRGTKPIVAVASGLMASGAYWLASQADSIVGSPSSEIGSVGAFMVHQDMSEMFAKDGVKNTIVRAGKYKAETNPFEPLSDDARAALQTRVDDAYALFVADLAKGRNVSVATVKTDFGQGRVLGPKAALSAGMIDKLGTVQSVIRDLSGAKAKQYLRASDGALPVFAAEDGAESVFAATDESRSPMFGVGDRVRATATHMTGMAGRVGAVNEARAGDPPYYAVDFDKPMGEGNPHRWLTEDEIEAESAAPSSGKKAPMKMSATRAAVMASDDFDSLMVTAASAGSLLVLLPSSDTTPPKAEEPPVDNPTPAPTGATVVAPSRELQLSELAALTGNQDKLYTWITGTKSVAEIRGELVAMQGKPNTVSAVTVGVQRETQKPFENFGAQLQSIMTAYQPGGSVDPRLFAAASGMSQGVPAEGGFLVAPEFSTSIWESMSGSPGAILPLTDNYTVTGESITFNADAETSRVAGSRRGGVQGYWMAEAAQYTGSKPKFRQVRIEPQDLGVFVYLTDKLIANSAVALQQYVSRCAADEITTMTTEAIVNGDGVGKPKGILSDSGIYVQVSKESSQAADTINQKNVSKMWARLHPKLRQNAVWLHNVDIEAELDNLSTVVKNVAGTENVGGYSNHVFDPQARTLKGRPLIACESCPTLGDVGDLILWAPQAYLTGTRGGVKEAMSIHLRFDYNESAFRFLFSVDGQPWHKSAITPLKGSNTLSSIVVLEAR